MKYRKKPVVIEAITFDELVKHGRANCGPHLHNGMPWSFNYQGQPITHHTDTCYVIPTLEGTMHFNRGDMLITGIKGEIYPCKPDIFEATYEKVEDIPSKTGEPWHEMVHALHQCKHPVIIIDRCRDCGTFVGPQP